MAAAAEYERLLAVGAAYVKNLLQAADANFKLAQFASARAQYVEIQSMAATVPIESAMKQHVAERLTRPEIVLAGFARRALTADNRTAWIYEESCAAEEEEEAPWRVGRDERAICPLVRSPPEVLDAALLLARCGREDVLCDIGCGDGRMLLAAARLGARAIGFDVNRSCLERSRATALQEGLTHVEVIDHDILQLAGHPRFEAATIVYVYLQPRCIDSLKSLLIAAVTAGKRVVIYCTTGVLKTAAAGNTLGELTPTGIAMGGLLRLYEKSVR